MQADFLYICGYFQSNSCVPAERGTFMYSIQKNILFFGSNSV